MRVIPRQVTVFRFPEHNDQIQTLMPAEERMKMEHLANEIANSLLLPRAPIVAFVIVGHTDPDPQGAEFEMQVSVQRAEVARSWLVHAAKGLVERQGGDGAEVDMVEFSLFGRGACNLFTEDTTFPGREKNRRVVVKYAAVELDPLTDAAGFAPNLARARQLIERQPQTDATRRVICALDKLANPETDDTYFEWSSLEQVGGGLGGLSHDEILGIARNVILSLRRHIADNNLYGVPNHLGVPFAPDDRVVSNLLGWEQSMRHTKSKLVETIAMPAPGQVHKSVARFIARNEDNPILAIHSGGYAENSILSCFKNT